MIATPLATPRGRTRRVLATVVVGGLAATTAADASRRWGTGRALLTAAAVVIGTAGVENVGKSTGVPFGRYDYAPLLRPQVAGVPAVVPAAWFAMALPSREVAHALLARRSTRWGRVALGAVALTAWDLFLDPQMVGEGYWSWRGAGRYEGIPVSNFAGWLGTSAAVMAALDVALPPEGAGDARLVGTYTWMAAMETLGFAAFFRRPVVAATGGTVMGGIAAAATARLVADRWRWRVEPARG